MPRHLTQLRRAALSFALLSAFALSAPGSAHAVSAPTPPPSVGNVGVSPATSDPNDPRTRAYFVITAPPGAVLRRHVRITNAGSEPARLLIDPVDGLTSQNTGSVFADRDVAVGGAGQWLRIPQRELTLAAGGETQVKFELRIPADARPGDHLAGVSVLNTASTTRDSGALSVTTQVRSVVGVLVKVPGAARAELAIGGAEVGLLPGSTIPAVTTQVSSPGQLLIKPHLRIRLQNAVYEKVVERDLDTILPGAEIALAQPWPERVEAGRYQLHVELSAPGMTAATWEGSIEVREALALPAPPSSASGGEVGGDEAGAAQPAAEPATWLLVLSGAGGLLLLLALLGAIWWAAVRRSRPQS